MKSSIIKWLLLSLVMSTAQRGYGETRNSVEESKGNRDRESPRSSSFWQKLKPDYAKLHFAGGMGVISAGAGWDYGRSKRWETDILFGYLPTFSGDRSCATFTLKQNYIPWKIPVYRRWSAEPLATGIYMNKLLGANQNFWVKEPEKYGGSYYRFSTAVRFSVFAGQRITYRFPPGSFCRSASVFYELSTNDLYIISAMPNKTIGMGDILVLAFGLKLEIF